MLTDIEKKVIVAIQDDIPVSEHPYAEIAEKIGLDEIQVVEILKKLCDRGIIRRYGATLRHQTTGFTANDMGAWQVEEERIEEVGEKMASFKQVSHCYRRDPQKTWPYNLYTMIHAIDEASCHETARRMAEAAGVKNYTLLFSKKELKKTSMVYFADDEE